MKEVLATVQNQEALSDGIFSLALEAPEIAKAAVPGQFVSLYLEDNAHLLPRPISICDAGGDTLRLVYRIAGAGTKAFSEKAVGEKIRVLGPLGNGFPEKKGAAVLFGGGIGVPPMLYLAKMRAEKGLGETTAILGFRDANTFLAEKFSSFSRVLIATEDGSVGTKGNVLDAYRAERVEAEVFYACGPTPMLKALRDFSIEQKKECYLSLEERMACGIGACLGCVQKTAETDSHSHVQNARVCKDGPVFPANKIVF